ncbi:hypothetical protein [Cysteiniphilum sp. 6C5]|uniref:hypothetical protein n=1 Tax=unclassified Cysteiniphilum TaxID=2610889 RepID=UPI003F85D4BC
MSTQNENDVTRRDRGFTVREDTIFDYLMHAATREDIAKLDAKIDRVANYLDTKIDTKIDTLRKDTKEDFNKLDGKIDRVEERLTKKIDSHFKWLTGLLIVAVIAPFVAKFFT